MTSDRPVRVLHVAESFATGVLEMLRLVAERCVAEGWPQAVAFGRRPESPAVAREAIAPPVELFELPWGARTPMGELRTVRALRAVRQQWRPDVVHLHSSFAGFTGGFAFGRRQPVVFTPHAFTSEVPGSRLRRVVLSTAERVAVRRATLVGAVSQSEADVARARGARDIVVIPNGIRELDEAPAAARGPDAGDRPRVIAVGRMMRQRQPEASARILAGVADVADVEWVGGGGAGRDAEAGRAALLAAGVPVTGWVPRPQLLGRMARAEVYLHWTSWDGMPYTVLEAMACDAVVVASDIAPNRELLDPRQICRSEPEAIALVRRLVADPALAGELRDAQAARRGAYSALAMTGRWLALYRELAP